VNISYIGTSAYATIKVSYGKASISGYIIDELTSGYLDNIHIAAFPDGSDPQISEAVVQNVSSDGRYVLALDLNSSMALDVYVKDYDVV
jgi:hypothetical protein